MPHTPTPITRRDLLTLAAVVVLLAVFQALPQAWHEVLRYDRHAVLQGELWRLWTGHLIHLGWVHWALNACGLVLCCALADAPPKPRTLLCQALVLGLGISVLFLLFLPHLAHYVGLSGVLYGLFVLALWPGVRRADPINIAALCAIAGWLGWQWIDGPARSEMELIGGNIIVHAHGFGVACALAMLAAPARRASRAVLSR